MTPDSAEILAENTKIKYLFIMTYSVKQLLLKQLKYALVLIQRFSLSKVEVFLDQKQIKNLKTIMNQSEVGIHLLFDHQLIIDVFKNEISEKDFFEVENLKNIQDDLLKLLQFHNLTEKQDFVRSLSPDRQNRIVRAYFYIIENNLKQAQKQPH